MSGQSGLGDSASRAASAIVCRGTARTLAFVFGALIRPYDLRPLPPVAVLAPPQPVRLERARRTRRADRASRARLARHLPDDPLPAGDRGAEGSDRRGDERWALPARRRRRRDPERTRRRPRLATGAHPPRDARGGDRNHPHALAWRLLRAPRQALPRRRRAHL